MTRRYTIETAAVVVLGLGVACAGVGCQRGEAPPPEEAPAPAKRSRGPDRQVFAPLVFILDRSAVQLPFLLENDEEIVDAACFQPIADVIEADVTEDVSEQIEDQRQAVSKVLRQWVRDEVSPSAVTDTSIDSWTITPEKVTSIEIDDTMARFADEEDCIDSSTGWMRRDVTVVAGLFGGTSFRFSTTSPIPRASAQKLIEELTAAGFPTTTDDIQDYELVKNDDGTPRKGDDGAKLYRHPDLGVVSENDITQPERQQMKTWTVTSDEPIVFAFRELNKAVWVRESAADECNVNVVWQDPIFREAECAQLAGTGFKAARTADGVRVEVKTGTKVESYDLQFGNVERIRLDDQIILWISPVQIEEGALIRTNSLVLAP